MLTCWLTEEHARWIAPHPPWAPLDEEGNDVPVYVQVSIIYRSSISVVINSLRSNQRTVVTKSTTLIKAAKCATQRKVQMLMPAHAFYLVYPQHVCTDLQLSFDGSIYHSWVQNLVCMFEGPMKRATEGSRWEMILCSIKYLVTVMYDSAN